MPFNIDMTISNSRILKANFRAKLKKLNMSDAKMFLSVFISFFFYSSL